MIETFPDREALADAAAGLIARRLCQAIAARGHAGFILTGGSSPGPVYDRLSRDGSVDWRKVTATLSDERWVEPSHPDSNEALVRARLQTGLAAPLGFTPLKYLAPSPDAGARIADEAVGDLFPVDITLLGMGEDGHIASLFPDDPIAEYALHPAAEKRVVAVAMSGVAPFLPRISLSLPALLDTELVLVLISGVAKKALIERVSAEQGYDPPVARLIRQTAVPVRIFWAP